MKGPFWIVVNRVTGEPVNHLGVHGSREAAQALLDQYLESYDVNLRKTFEAREQPRSIPALCLSTKNESLRF